MAQEAALLFVPFDKSLVPCKKSKVSLRGPFLRGEEVDLPWIENGKKMNYVSMILQTSVKEHYDALNLMGEKLAPHVEEYVAQNASMSDIIKMLLTESQKISLEELCNELGLPVQHDEGDVENGKRKRKQTKKAKESQEQDVNDENAAKENEGVKVGGKFKCRKKSVPSDKVLKENAQNHAAVAGCLNMIQEANLCKFQTAFSDQVKLNPETHTTSLSGDFANHTISSLIPIDAPKAISNIMTTTTPTSSFTEDSVQVTNTEARNGSSTSAHDQSLSPIFQFPILKASVKKNPSQSSSLHTNKRQPFKKASNFSSLPGAMVSSNSSIIIQSSKVTSHHAQPHPQHCHAPINDLAVPESFHNTQHPPPQVKINGVPQNYNIPSRVPEIEYQPPAIPTHSRSIIQGTTDRQENKIYTELTPMPSTLHTTGQLLSSAIGFSDCGPVTPERANDSSLTLPSQMPDYQSTPNGRINNYEDKVKQLQEEVQELKKENESLRSELQSLQGASAFMHMPSSLEVIKFLEAQLANFAGRPLAQSTTCNQSSESYAIRANLAPEKGTSAQTRLVDTYPYMVDRDKLRKAVSCGHSRGPKHMLKKVVHLVFTDEELANSCGQGIYGTADAEGKEPLDKMKIAACKDHMIAFCIKHNIEEPTEKL